MAPITVNRVGRASVVAAAYAGAAHTHTAGPMSVHVIYSEHDLQGAGHSGVLGNQPEERKRLVLAKLRGDAGARFTFRAVARAEPNLDLALVAHSAGLVGFLTRAYDAWSALWEQQTDTAYLEPFCATKHGRSHFVPAYVAPRFDGLQRDSGTILGSIAYYALDRETPLCESSVSSLCWDMAVVRASVAHLVEHRGANGTAPAVVYAPVTHPGHHVGASYYGGFCFLNNAVIAARLLQATYARVAIIDIDYHAPNGTMSLVWNDPSICLVSLHADPAVDYPYNCGFADQTGATDNVLNIPLPKGTAMDTYRDHLRTAIDKAAQFRPDALVVSLGLDTLDKDPVAYPTAVFSLHPQDFHEIGEMLLHSEPLGKLPRLVMQEGGYLLSDVPDAVHAFLVGAAK